MNRERWLVLAPLVDRALELTGDARVTWLAELRMRSPALAAELTAFLSREDVADRRGFLSEPLDVKLEGLTLGAYTIERPLGEGGMGTVWLARRTDGQGDERAAVKFLNLALASAAGKERFRREGAMLTRLDHPAIARLFDAGLTQTGQPFLVLEYVDGVRIDAYVETQQLSLDERIRLVLQVLAAVGHAHANRIVHRDLKPSNILVTRDRSVKLLDFGIAKLLDDRGIGERTAFTLASGPLLTPELAAPEQVRGDVVATTTDVYALGVILYVLVSGRHPTAEGARAPADTLRALMEVQPVPVAPPALDAILAKALRKSPSERYQTVSAFAQDLGRFLGDPERRG